MTLRCTDGFEHAPLTLKGDGHSVRVLRDGSPTATVTCSAPPVVAQQEATVELTLEPGQALAAMPSRDPVVDVQGPAFRARASTDRWWRDWVAGFSCRDCGAMSSSEARWRSS